MAHTIQGKKKLLHRANRLRGQVEAAARALENEEECGKVLLTLAACRGAINALMAEILEGHVRFHVLDPEQKPSAAQATAADELVAVINRYLK